MAGRVAAIADGHDIMPIPLEDLGARPNLLVPVWQNGELLVDWSLDEIRARATAASLPR
jgi:nicotinamide phosphoribosyltransferase